MTDRSTIRSTWRPPVVIVRADDRAVNWMAFSPVVVSLAWVVLWSFGLMSGLGASPDAFAAPGAGLYAFGTIAALVDRRGLAARGFAPLPSVLWCFATPFAYLPLRKRALDRTGYRDSWFPTAIHAVCFGAVLLVCLAVLGIEAVAAAAVR